MYNGQNTVQQLVQIDTVKKIIDTAEYHQDQGTAKKNSVIQRRNRTKLHMTRADLAQYCRLQRY